jgi:two-component system response regulator HydG
MHKYRILIVCPEPQGLSLLTSMLKSLGHLIEEAATDRAAVRLMERNPISLVLASVDPGDADALELLNYVRRKHPDVPVILMFPRVHPDRAKEALRLGAMAILKYPVPAAELRAAVLQAMEQFEPAAAYSAAATSGTAIAAPASGGVPGRPHLLGPGNHMGPAADPRELGSNNGILVGQNPAPNEPAPALMTLPPVSPATIGAGRLAPVEPVTPSGDVALVTTDPGLRQIIELAGSLATSPASILISGESGTGKSLFAQFIHHCGGRSDRPFVTLNAEQLGDRGGQPGDDAEAGAIELASGLSDWAGKLARARGGTLFIQEVGALTTDLQLQLYRELQLQDIELAAGHPRIPSRPSVRFVISTSENLAALLEQGGFRPELYHRICSLCLMIPPLRHRGADIEVLSEHFRAHFSQEFRKDVAGLTRDAIDTLQRHDWPGNVRELKGVIQRAVARCSGPRITSGHLAPILNLQRQARSGAAGAARPHLPMGLRPLKEALEEPEKRIIIQALQAFNWNRQETAKVLDINRTTLYKKMKKYGLLIDEPMWMN